MDQPFYLHVAYNAPHFGKGWNEAKCSTENVMQPKPEDLQLVSPILRSTTSLVCSQSGGDGCEHWATVGRGRQAVAARQTLVIFMTDHGGDPAYGGSNLPFRGGKATLYEGGIRVPCIVRWPDQIGRRSICDRGRLRSRLVATFGQIVGFEAKRHRRQIDCRLLHGKPADDQRTLVWKTGAHQELGRKSWQAVRDGDWKWVQPPEQDGELSI